MRKGIYYAKWQNGKMRISELIKFLEKLKKENGDLPVFCVDGSYDWDELPVNEKHTEVRIVEGWEGKKAHLEVGKKYVMIRS